MTEIRVAHAIHSGGFYGAERVVHDLIRWQAASGTISPSLLDIVDWGCDASELGRRVLSDGAEVAVLGARRGVTANALRSYAEVLHLRRTSVVHSHGYKPTVLHVLSRMLRLHSVPIVVSVHGYGLTSPSFKDRVYQHLDLFMLRQADAVVAVSSAMARFLATEAPGLSVTTIPNGVDASGARTGRHPLRSHLARIATARAPNLSYSVTVGSVGRLVPMKNHALLIDVVAELRRDGVPCIPVILGDGPLSSALKEQWLATIPDVPPLLIPHQEDVLDWISDMDVFCMPSGPGEGLPMALLEAGLLGRAVLCSDSGGMADLVVSGVNGLRFPMGDRAALRQSLLELVTDESLRARLGEGLRKTVSTRHLIQTAGCLYTEVYKTVTS